MAVAGFERPDDPGDLGTPAPRLPSWAVTSRPPVDGIDSAPSAPDDGSFADLGVRRDVTRAPRAEPPVSRIPEHPFDIDEPFGDKQPGGASAPWMRGPADDTEVRLVDLADEFHLTTVQALEVCEASGTPATSRTDRLSERRVSVISMNRTSRRRVRASSKRVL